MKIKASNAGLWSICAAAPQAQAAQLPDLYRGEDFTREGLAAHWAAAEVMRGHPVAEGQVTPQGVVLTDDILTPVNAYVSALLAIAPAPMWTIEFPLTGRFVLPDQRVVPDAFTVGANGKLWVFDFKFGFRPVPVFRNPALIIYAAEILSACGTEDSAPVGLAIFQPRDYTSGDGPLRVWDTTAGEVYTLATDLQRRAKIAAGLNPPYRPGGHCGDCGARHACPSLAEKVASGMDFSAWETPEGLPDELAGRLYSELGEFIKVMETRREGFKAQIEHALRSGKRVPGWVLEPRAGRETWKIPPDVVGNLGKIFGVNDLVSLKAVTPKQAAEKGLPSAVIDGNVQRTTSLEAVPVSTEKLKKLIID